MSTTNEPTTNGTTDGRSDLDLIDEASLALNKIEFCEYALMDQDVFGNEHANGGLGATLSEAIASLREIIEEFDRRHRAA